MIMAVVDATAAIGPGDRTVLERACARSSGPAQRAADHADDRHDVPGLIVVVNKIDRAPRRPRCSNAWPGPRRRSTRSADLPTAEYFPVSARTGQGVDELTAHLIGAAARGPAVLPA